MDSAPINWMNALAAGVLIIAAIFVIFFSAAAISRVNGYTKQYEGIDLVLADEWAAADDPNSGLNRIKGIQNSFLAGLVVTLILAALVTLVLYKLFGAPAAAIYAACLFFALIYGFISLYYLSSLGKSRIEGSNGDVGNGADVDVNHTFLSTTSMNLAFMIVHAILAGALGIYFVATKRKSEKADPAVEPITGKGLSSSTAATARRPLPGAGRAYWQSLDRHI